MNKYDVNKKKLKIGDIVVLCNCLEATTRNFEFWEVYADSKIESCVFIRGLSTGKSDCFDCEKLKKVDKKYKELVDKATPKKISRAKTLENDVKIGRATFKKGVSLLQRCPSCGEWLHPLYHKNYCGNCRQRIDRSEEE